MVSFYNRGNDLCDSTCKSGYVLDATFNCQLCANNCISCNSNGAGKCDTVIKNFNFNILI